MTGIKIMHLSDLHFHESSDGSLHHQRHSLECMLQIEPILQQEDPDILLITGDLTNIGDPNNLDRVYQWIHDKINVKANYYGLRAAERKCQILIVPGNHDAFNARTSGANWKRWQSALSNYYTAFPEYVFDDKGVSYTWIEKGDTRLFIVLIDSTYLGDPETDSLPHTLSLSRVAKGKISGEQCARILSLYDDGVQGNLKNSEGKQISRAEFLSSFKLLVMHHYLFEPSSSKATPLLHVRQKRCVFQNLAMADFDGLLCGHKHLSDFSSFVYLDHFEPRGKIRYALNHIRRVLGIKSLPLNQTETEGKSFSKAWRFLLSIMYLNHVDEHGITDKIAEGVIQILEDGLRSKHVIKDQVMSYLTKQRAGGAGRLFEKDEILFLHRQIMKHFKNDRRSELMRLAESIKPLVAKLASRPFTHVVAGSATKSCEVGSRERSFNAYEIESMPKEQMCMLRVKRYSWDHSSTPEGGRWGEHPLIQNVEMPFSRSRWEVIERAVE